MSEIVENGEQLDVSQEQADSLITLGVVYICDEDGQYHFMEGHSWGSIGAISSLT